MSEPVLQRKELSLAALHLNKRFYYKIRYKFM